MVQGIMKWTSTTREFGLVTPDDGGRDVFVRFSSALAPPCISEGRGGKPVKDAIATTQPRHPVASRVEVRTRYQQGQWVGGYEIAQVVELVYRILRPCFLEALPDVFVPSDVRDAGD